MGQEILKFTKMSGKSQEKYQYEGLIPNFDGQCHDVVAQSPSRWQEMQGNAETYFYSIRTFCKLSHNSVVWYIKMTNHAYFFVK